MEARSSLPRPGLMPRRLVVTGETGRGKTWLCALLAEQLEGRVVVLSDRTWPGSPDFTYGSHLIHDYHPEASEIMAAFVAGAAKQARERSALLVLDCSVRSSLLTVRDGQPTAYFDALQEVWRGHDEDVVLTATPRYLQNPSLTLGRHALIEVSHAEEGVSPWSSTGRRRWGVATITAPSRGVSRARIPYLSHYGDRLAPL